MSQYKKSALKRPKVAHGSDNEDAKNDASEKDDSDEDEHIGSRARKKDTTIFSLDSSDEEDETKCPPIHKQINEEDEVEEDDVTAISKQAKQVVDDLIDEKMRIASDDAEAQVASQNSTKESKTKLKTQLTTTEEEVKKYQSILDKIRKPNTNSSSSSSSSSSTTSVEDEGMPEADIARTRKKATSHASLQNLPQVRTQLQRFATAAAVSVGGMEGGHTDSGTSSTGETMHFVTRLNGKHIWKWQLGSAETFEKVLFNLCLPSDIIHLAVYFLTSATFIYS